MVEGIDLSILGPKQKRKHEKILFSTTLGDFPIWSCPLMSEDDEIRVSDDEPLVYCPKCGDRLEETK